MILYIIIYYYILYIILLLYYILYYIFIIYYIIYCILLYYIILYIILYNIILYDIVLYYMILYIILYYIKLYYIKYNIILYIWLGVGIGRWFLRVFWGTSLWPFVYIMFSTMRTRQIHFLSCTPWPLTLVEDFDNKSSIRGSSTHFTHHWCSLHTDVSGNGLDVNSWCILLDCLQLRYWTHASVLPSCCWVARLRNCVSVPQRVALIKTSLGQPQHCEWNPHACSRVSRQAPT